MITAVRRVCARATGLLMALVLIGLSTTARAQIVGAASARDIGGSSHAWVVLKQEDGGEFFLVHLPPRQRVGADGVLRGAEPGTVRVAARLKNEPAGVAASGGEVFLAFERQERDGYEVVSLAAVPAGLGDLWRYEPEDRLTQRPRLRTRGKLAAFFSAAGRPVAIVAPDSSFADADVRIFDGEVWRKAVTPPDVSAALRREQGTVLAYATSGGFALAVGEGTRVAGWDVRVPVVAPVRRQAGERPAAVTSGLGSPVEPEPIALGWESWEAPAVDLGPGVGRLMAGGSELRWALAGSVLEIWAELGARESRLIAMDGVGADARVLAMDDVGRVVVAWTESAAGAGSDAVGAKGADAASGGKARSKLALAEVSGSSGEMVFRGGPVGAGPISVEQFRTLGVVLVVLTIAVLLVALFAPAKDDRVHLDAGMSLADPGRRSVAAIIDGLVAVVVAAGILGVPVLELLSPLGFLTSGGMVALLTLAVGAGAGSVCEAAFGRTLGKMIVGCEVVGVRTGEGSGPGTGRARVWQCVARNLMKWGLPPLSALALMDASGRHKGEAVSRTAVVVRFEDGSEGA